MAEPDRRTMMVVTHMLRWTASTSEDEAGQAMVEYALVLFLVALVSIAILGTLGGTVSSMFSDVLTDF